MVMDEAAAASHAAYKKVSLNVFWIILHNKENW